MNDIKASLARIFIAIINADGIVSMKELEYLEKEIKPKYRLSSEDFDNSKKLTFAEASQIVKSEIENSYFERFKNKILTVVEDMENLSRVDGNTQIHPREALLCLGFRLFLETNYCKIISCYNNYLRFSKSDVLYVNTEMEQEDYYNEVIQRNYNIICYMFQSFGFNFVSISRIKEMLLGYSDEYFEEIIRHFYPDLNEIDIVRNAIKYQLCKVSTISFSRNLLQGQNKIDPSVLIKIGSTQARNRDGMTDFILLNINKEGVLAPLQDFLFKYDYLCEDSKLMVQRGRLNNEFHVKSFHRTFFEYLMQLTRKIEIHLFYENIARIEFGCIRRLPINRTYDKALYITLLYYAAKREPFIVSQRRPLDKYPNDRTIMQVQYDKFCRIYGQINNGGELIRDIDGFYSTRLSMIRNHLNECFETITNEYIKLFVPILDKNKKEMNMRFSYVKLVMEAETNIESDICWDELIKWVDSIV